MDSTMYALNNV